MLALRVPPKQSRTIGFSPMFLPDVFSRAVGGEEGYGGIGQVARGN